MARAPAAEQKSRQLLLLGGFELRWAGGTVMVQRSGQRLLALLALQRRPLERLHVAGTLWLDASEERAGGLVPGTDRGRSFHSDWRSRRGR